MALHLELMCIVLMSSVLMCVLHLGVRCTYEKCTYVCFVLVLKSSIWEHCTCEQCTYVCFVLVLKGSIWEHCTCDNGLSASPSQWSWDVRENIFYKSSPFLSTFTLWGFIKYVWEKLTVPFSKCRPNWTMSTKCSCLLWKPEPSDQDKHHQRVYGHGNYPYHPLSAPPSSSSYPYIILMSSIKPESRYTRDLDCQLVANPEVDQDCPSQISSTSPSSPSSSSSPSSLSSSCPSPKCESQSSLDTTRYSRRLPCSDRCPPEI